MVGFGRARLGMVRYGAVWHGRVRYGVVFPIKLLVWFGMTQ